MEKVENVSRSFSYFEWVCDEFMESFVIVPLAVAPVFRCTEVIMRPHDTSFIIVVRYGRDEYFVVGTK